MNEIRVLVHDPYVLKLSHCIAVHRVGVAGGGWDEKDEYFHSSTHSSVDEVHARSNMNSERFLICNVNRKICIIGL